jgi:hypothetical protein
MNKVAKIAANFDKLRSIGDRGWLRAAAFIAFGQRAWNKSKIESLNVVGEFSYTLPPDLAEEVRAGEFRRSVILNGLLEIEQGFAAFLNEVYKISLLATLHGKPAPEDIKARMRAIESDNDIASKMRTIDHEFGLKAGKLVEHARSWSQARNCLQHARGIVRHSDCTVDDTLVISWMERTRQDGIVQILPKRRTFRIGGIIDLSEEEMFCLCFTAHLGVKGYVDILEQFAKSKVSPQSEGR